MLGAQSLLTADPEIPRFLQAGATCRTLLLVLRSVGFAQHVMAWIMSRDGLQSKQRKKDWDMPRLRLPEGATPKTKLETMLEFFDPKRSPSWQALADGAATLQPEGSVYWDSVLEFNRAGHKTGILKIWQNLLPCLAHMLLKSCAATLRYPWRLILTLSPDMELRSRIAEEFYNYSPCCLPRGLKPFHDSLTRPEDVLAAEARAIITELMWQTDLSIFDRECGHSQTRAHIEAANGKTPTFENVCFARFGKEVWQHFQHLESSLQKPQAPHKRGRTPRCGHVKRQRYDAWNAYVEYNKGLATGVDGGQNNIRKGGSPGIGNRAPAGSRVPWIPGWGAEGGGGPEARRKEGGRAGGGWAQELGATEPREPRAQGPRAHELMRGERREEKVAEWRVAQDWGLEIRSRKKTAGHW